MQPRGRPASGTRSPSHRAYRMIGLTLLLIGVSLLEGSSALRQTWQAWCGPAGPKPSKYSDQVWVTYASGERVAGPPVAASDDTLLAMIRT